MPVPSYARDRFPVSSRTPLDNPLDAELLDLLALFQGGYPAPQWLWRLARTGLKAIAGLFAALLLPYILYFG